MWSWVPYLLCVVAEAGGERRVSPSSAGSGQAGCAGPLTLAGGLGSPNQGGASPRAPVWSVFPHSDRLEHRVWYLRQVIECGVGRREAYTRHMVHGKNRIPYRIDRRLTGLAGPDYDATISFGLPFEPEDSQYGEYRLIRVSNQ